MVETLMRLARTIISSTFEVRVAGRPTWAEHGQDRLGQAWENHRAYLTRIDQLFPDFIWRPMRIRDADLRQKANDLNREQHNLGQLVLARFGMTDPSKLEEWQVQTDEKAGNVERLLMEVDERMDELGW